MTKCTYFLKNNLFLGGTLMKKSEVSLTKVATTIKEKGNKNMSYAKKMFEEKIETNEVISKYIPLLEIVEFDKMIAMINYRCNKTLYDQYKTRNDDGVYTISPGSRCRMIEDAFGNNLDADGKATLIESSIILPYDHKSQSLRIDLLADEIYHLFGKLIKLDDVNNRLFYKTKDSIEVIEDYDDYSFAAFLRYPISSIISANEAIAAINSFKRMLSYSNSYKESVIQFDDCYIRDGKVHEGFYSEGFARFTIKRKVLKAIKNRKTSVHSKELDELMLHLCNYDEQTKERFLDVMSTVFLNNAEFKQLYNFSPRIVGKDGRNGKSVFKSVIEKAFGGHTSSNVAAFRMSRLDDPRTLYHVVHALVAIDGDSSTKQINEDAAEAFKCITTGDPISVRALYGEEKEVPAMTMMIEFSNDFPMSADKSAAYLRRLEFIRCDYQLITDKSELGPNSKMPLIELNQEWFNAIRSEIAAQYLIESLLIRSQRIRETGEIGKRSDQMHAMLTMYSYENNSALAFYEEFGADQIVGRTVKEIKEKYRSWCDENDLTVMKKKFIETLESQGLKRARVSFRNLSVDSDQFYYCQVSDHLIVAWQFANIARNKLHFQNLHQTEKDLYQLRDEQDLQVDDDLNKRSYTKKSFKVDFELVKAINLFMHDRLPDEEFDRVAVAIVKDLFDDWCKENNVEYVTPQRFNKTIENCFNRYRKNCNVNGMNISDEKKEQYRSEGVRLLSAWLKND